MQLPDKPEVDENTKKLIQIAKRHPGPYYAVVPPFVRDSETREFRMACSGAELRVSIPKEADVGDRIWFMLGDPITNKVEGCTGKAPPPPMMHFDPDASESGRELIDASEVSMSERDLEGTIEAVPCGFLDQSTSAVAGEKIEEDETETTENSSSIDRALRPSTMRGHSFEEDPPERPRSMRPDTMRGSSFDDSLDDAEDRDGAGPSSLRPQTLRGHSMMSDDSGDRPPRRAGRRPSSDDLQDNVDLGDEEEDSDDDYDGPRNLRPQMIRGNSFDDDVVGDGDQEENQHASGSTRRGGRRVQREIPEPEPFEPEEVDLRHIGEREKREYGWERPEWAGKGLRPTPKGEAVKQGESLAIRASKIAEHKDKLKYSNELPEWANRSLRSTSRGEAVKQGASLAVAPTHISVVAAERNIKWEKPVWTIQSPLRHRTAEQKAQATEQLKLPFNESFSAVDGKELDPEEEEEVILVGEIDDTTTHSHDEDPVEVHETTDEEGDGEEDEVEDDGLYEEVTVDSDEEDEESEDPIQAELQQAVLAGGV